MYIYLSDKRLIEKILPKTDIQYLGTENQNFWGADFVPIRQDRLHITNQHKIPDYHLDPFYGKKFGTLTLCRGFCL
jgi:hypothetical protein